MLNNQPHKPIKTATFTFSCIHRERLNCLCTQLHLLFSICVLTGTDNRPQNCDRGMKQVFVCERERGVALENSARGKKKKKILVRESHKFLGELKLKKGLKLLEDSRVILNNSS